MLSETSSLLWYVTKIGQEVNRGHRRALCPPRAACPDTATCSDATRHVQAKRSWIYRKLAEKDALVGPPIVNQFVDGEGLTYLGRSYRLQIVHDGNDVRLDRGRFLLPTHLVPDGPVVMRRWYRRTGSRWLQRRIELGYRPSRTTGATGSTSTGPRCSSRRASSTM